MSTEWYKFCFVDCQLMDPRWCCCQLTAFLLRIASIVLPSPAWTMNVSSPLGYGCLVSSVIYSQFFIVIAMFFYVVYIQYRVFLRRLVVFVYKETLKIFGIRPCFGCFSLEVRIRFQREIHKIHTQLGRSSRGSGTAAGYSGLGWRWFTAGDHCFGFGFRHFYSSVLFLRTISFCCLKKSVIQLNQGLLGEKNLRSVTTVIFCNVRGHFVSLYRRWQPLSDGAVKVCPVQSHRNAWCLEKCGRKCIFIWFFIAPFRSPRGAKLSDKIWWQHCRIEW